MIVGIVALLATSIICFTLFGDSMKMDMSGQINLEMDCEALDISQEDILEGLEEDNTNIKHQSIQFGDSNGGMTLSISDQDYKTADIKFKDNMLVAKLETEAYTVTLKEVEEK